MYPSTKKLSTDIEFLTTQNSRLKINYKRKMNLGEFFISASGLGGGTIPDMHHQDRERRSGEHRGDEERHAGRVDRR